MYDTGSQVFSLNLVLAVGDLLLPDCAGGLGDDALPALLAPAWVAADAPLLVDFDGAHDPSCGPIGAAVEGRRQTGVLPADMLVSYGCTNGPGRLFSRRRPSLSCAFGPCRPSASRVSR